MREEYKSPMLTIFGFECHTISSMSVQNRVEEDVVFDELI